MLSRTRNLGFGAVQLRISGPLCALPWPLGASQCESAVADGVEITTEIVGTLPEVREAVADGVVWRCERVADGVRYAVLADGSARVVADITRRSEHAWHLRVVNGQVPSAAAAWFDILVQLVVSSVAPSAGGVTLHGACVAVDGRAVILSGTSGVGKTTLARRLVAAGARPLSHDRTLVFPGWVAVSTPWGHDGELPTLSRSLPLAAVLMLGQSLTNTSTALHGARGVMRVAGSMIGGWTAKAVTDEALGVVSRLVAEVPCFSTDLTNDERATRHVMELLA